MYKDIKDVFDINEDYDFVYIDTPYLNDSGMGVDYADFYHFLNGLIDYENWNNLIEEWIADKDIPLIIRKETNKRGQSFVHPCGREIIVSDNTVAIWAYSNVLKGKIFTISQIKKLLDEKELPVVFMATKEIKAKAKYTKPLGSYALSNWRVCHIQSVGFNTNTNIEDLKISDIEDHFRKYVNPNNMFVLPKEIGYLGEIDEFIEEQKR